MDHGDDFLDRTQKHKQQNKKYTRREYTKLKSFCTVKETINKLKRQHTEWEKIFASHLSDKGLKSKIYKELLNSYNSIAKESPLKNGQTWIDIFQMSSKEDIWKANRYVKDAQQHQSLGKCKSKPQWDITSCL